MPVSVDPDCAKVKTRAPVPPKLSETEPAQFPASVTGLGLVGEDDPQAVASSTKSNTHGRCIHSSKNRTMRWSTTAASVGLFTLSLSRSDNGSEGFEFVCDAVKGKSQRSIFFGEDSELFL